MTECNEARTRGPYPQFQSRPRTKTFRFLDFLNPLKINGKLSFVLL